jgi:hypothetical protein
MHTTLHGNGRSRRGNRPGVLGVLCVLCGSTVAVMLLLLCGCTHRFDPATGTVRKDAVAYRVGDPGPGWTVIDRGGDAAYANRELHAGIAANASCAERGDPPLRVLLNHLLIGFTEKKFAEEQIVALDGREALRVVVAAKLDGVPRRCLFYVLKKDGCVYDLQYEAPETSFSAGLPAFEAFVKGFGTIK